MTLVKPAVSPLSVAEGFFPLLSFYDAWPYVSAAQLDLRSSPKLTLLMSFPKKAQEEKGRLYPRLYQFYGPMTSFLGVSAFISVPASKFWLGDTVSTSSSLPRCTPMVRAQQLSLQRRIGLPLMLLS